MGQGPQGDPDGWVLVGAFIDTGESEDFGAGSNYPGSLVHVVTRNHTPQQIGGKGL